MIETNKNARLSREDVLQKYEEAKNVWTDLKVVTQATRTRIVTDDKSGNLYWTNTYNVDFCIFNHMTKSEYRMSVLEELAEIYAYYIVGFAKNSLYGNRTPPTIRQTLIWIPEEYLSQAVAMKFDKSCWDDNVTDGIRMVKIKLYSGQMPNVVQRMAMSFNGC